MIGPADAVRLGPALVWLFSFLIVWFTIMGVTGWLAGRKGRDSGNWALIALILGPVALLMVLLMRRREPPVD